MLVGGCSGSPSQSLRDCELLQCPLHHFVALRTLVIYSASDLEEKGMIDKSQKGVLKDLIISGDAALQSALDRYESGDPDQLVTLMQHGLLDRRDSLDLLHDLDLNFLSVGLDDDDDHNNGSADVQIFDDEQHHSASAAACAAGAAAAQRNSSSSSSARAAAAGTGSAGSSMSDSMRGISMFQRGAGGRFEHSRPRSGSVSDGLGPWGPSSVTSNMSLGLALGSSLDRGSLMADDSGGFSLDNMTFDTTFESDYGRRRSDSVAAAAAAMQHEGPSSRSSHPRTLSIPDSNDDQHHLYDGDSAAASPAVPDTASSPQARQQQQQQQASEAAAAAAANSAVAANQQQQQQQRQHSTSSSDSSGADPHRQHQQYESAAAVPSPDAAAAAAAAASGLRMTTRGVSRGTRSGGSSSSHARSDVVDMPDAAQQHRHRHDDSADELSGDFSPQFHFSFTDDLAVDMAANLKHEHMRDLDTLALGTTGRNGLLSTGLLLADSLMYIGGSSSLDHHGSSRGAAAAGGVPVPVTRPPPPERNGPVGAYSPNGRKKRIERFMEKRKHRVWTKTVKYDVRKNFADTRMRVKGRFVKKDDEALLREVMALC
jgi:CCT motif